MSTSGETKTFPGADSDTGTGRLEVRCPNCHLPIDVAVDTRLTDLTCSACGSHFSLVDQSDATRIAPSLATVGRFDLIERLGIGGFGTVWKARDKQLDRTVAIKVPRQASVSAEESEKFFREARAAAQLRHPNIVSVHEVGRDGDSLFIVSDFVRGVTLGDWLTGQRLTSREAAELCAKIAEALHHAHEQGVVHRDLKPSNIIIDGSGEPHLMDFGLARREVGEVTLTLDGQVVGTPAYMSPEQAQGEGHRADRRSDIYSLGVMLFQLITGELPFRGNVRMLMHQVINDEPPTPRKFNGSIPRDLETVTLKSLEKDPSRRYQTAADFADELQRFLAGEPIQARPVGRPERAVRWIRRNPTVAALSSAVALALLSGTIVSMYFAAHAHQQAAAALNSERNALASKEESDESRAEEARARREAEAVTEFLLYKDAGRVDDAIPLFEETLRTRLDKLGADHADTLTAMTNLAVAYAEAKRFDHAIQLHEQMLASRQSKLGASSPETLASMHALAHLLLKAARHAEAIALFEATRDTRVARLGANNPESIAWSECLVSAYQAAGRQEDALNLQQEIVTARRDELGDLHPETLASIYNLAVNHKNAGRLGEAIPLFQQVMAARQKTLGPDNSETLLALDNLVVGYQETGQSEAAIPLLEEALETRRKKLGPDHPDTITAMTSLADGYSDTGRRDQAIQLYESILAAQREKFGAEHADTINSMSNLVTEYRLAGRPEQSAAIQKELLEARRRVFGSDEEASYLSPSMETLRQGIGQTQVVEFEVVSIGGTSSLLYLNSAADYRNPDCFAVGIATFQFPRLASQGISKRDELLKRRVRVTGELQDDDGRMLIVVDDISKQLELKTPAGHWVRADSPAAAIGDELVTPAVSELRRLVGPPVELPSGARVPSMAQLLEQMGGPQTVTFRVQLVGGNDHRYLNSKINFLHPECFTSVIEPSQVAAFDALVPDAASGLIGELVRVSGKVEERDGRIQIRVSDLTSQLELLTSAATGDRYARNGKFAEAAEQYRLAIRKTPDDHGSAVRLALLLMELGDRGGYESVCREMLERFGAADDIMAARRTAQACLVSNPPVGDLSQLLQLTEFAVEQTQSTDNNWLRALACRERGLAAYRAGDWEGALKWSEQSRDLDMSDPYWALNLVVEAMALYEQGKREEASAAFDDSVSLIAQAFPNAPDELNSDLWLDWFVYQQLRREATARLKSE